MIGILGGAFNPIHVGHLTLAEEARAQLGLESVILLPSATPPHKGINTDFRHRVNMCRLARAGNLGTQVSDVEFTLARDNAVTLTIDVLKLLKTTPETHCFIMGGDSMASFMTWDDPEGICERVTLAYCERPMVHVMDDVFPANANVKRVQVPGLNISSTAVREAMEMGDAWRYLVTENVYRYIIRNKLYQEK